MSNDATKTYKSPDGKHEVVGLTLPADDFRVSTGQVFAYNFRCDAFYRGSVVATHTFPTSAENDQQALNFVNNHMAVWGQTLSAQGTEYDRLAAFLLSKS